MALNAVPIEGTMISGLISAAALIGFLGIGAQWLAWRLQAPAIVLMAVAGLFVGPLCAVMFGTPLLNPDLVFNGGGQDVLRPIVSLAVAVILFEGGLALRFENLRDAGPVVRRMVFVGGPVAWVLGAFAAKYAAGLDWISAIVFAGVMVVTGPTVIMPLLRQSKLGGRPAAALKWEGIVNDPVGALFAVAAYEVVYFASKNESMLAAIVWIVVAAVLGCLLGIIFGRLIVHMFRLGLTPEFLKAPIIFASIIVCYALAELIEKEIGLVAVTAYGMTLANSRMAGFQELLKFKEDIAVLLVSGVFIILTANLTPETIASALNYNTLIFLVCMLFVVRPVSVWVSTYGTLSRNEAILLGWIAPRGIVAVAVSGLFGSLLIELDGQPYDLYGADQIAPLAFAMVFATVVLHGFTLAPLARALGLARKSRSGVLLVGANSWSIALARVLHEAEIPIILADSNERRLTAASDAGLPTFFGEVLSEEAEANLDHAAFDQVVGTSTNEPYNALVAKHFAPELGQHRVYRLDSADGGDEDSGFSRHTGRVIIANGRSYDGLVRDQFSGWHFVATQLTDDYTLEAFVADNPEANAVVEITADSSVIFLGPDRAAKGGAGASLISFGPEKPETKPSDVTN